MSLFDGMADWMNVPYLQYTYGKVFPKRVGLSHPTISPYGGYETKDKKKVLFSIQNDREWQIFCSKILKNKTLINNLKFNTPSKRLINKKALDKIIVYFFKQQNSQYLLREMQLNKIACGSLNDIKDLAIHPQLEIAECLTEKGKVNFIAPPIKYKDKVKYKKVPSLGEDSRFIRKEFSKNG